MGLWAFGVSRTHVTRLGPYGLPPALPWAFYAGIAVFVVGAATELARRRPSSWRMAAHAVTQVVMLYATAPLVYSQGRYEWFYKTVGRVQYINLHGHLNSHIDIYQNWPGFFALAAWFDKVAGTATPLSYGKWAQLLFELAALPLLFLIYRSLGLGARQRWLALLLYSASNWIGQDYFSPQALGTLLGLGVMALAIRWLYENRLTEQPGENGTNGKTNGRDRPKLRSGKAIILALLLVFYVLSFTHELSPYILVVQLAMVAAVRMLAPRWLPAALAAIALGYFLPRYSFVASHYSILNIGSFFYNAAPPSLAGGTASSAETLIERCAEGLSVGMWVLAAAGAWLHRHAGRSVLALVLLAYSPAVMLAVSDYGHEGILRVYLFSLPWSAALASLALVPSARVIARLPQSGFLASKVGAVRWCIRVWATAASKAARLARAVRRSAQVVARTLRLPTWRLSPGSLRAPVALAAALALFFPAFFGNDNFNRMSRQEVAVATSFWRTARAGTVYVPIDNAPVADTGHYNLFPLKPIFGNYGLLRAAPVTSGIAARLAAAAGRSPLAGEPAYVLVTTNMIVFNQAHGVARKGSFAILLRSLARSPSWRLVVHKAGIVIYELPPPSLPASLPGA